MEWISNNHSLLFDKLKDKEFIELKPNNYSDTYFLIHGFGSSFLDLVSLAEEIFESGKRVVLILLDGHKSEVIDKSKMTIDTWKKTSLNVIEKCIVDSEDNYLLGFSIGSLISLQIASEKQFDFKGIIGISTYTGANSNINKFVGGLDILGLKEVNRRLQVSNKKSVENLAYIKKFNVDIVKQINIDSKKMIEEMSSVESEVLMFHSYDDLVADYNMLKDTCNLKCEKFDIVTLRGLKHFAQLDIPSKRLFEFIETHFKYVDDDSTPEFGDSKAVQILHEEGSREISQSVGFGFNLLIGFFSIFGAFLYFTLPIVTTKDVTSPYYIVAYSLIIHIYMIAASSYIFYMNRSIAYIRNHIEPYMPVISINEYKNNGYIAGKESMTTTKIFSSISMILPLITSIGAMGYNLFTYENRFFVREGRNVLLQSSFVASVLLLFAAMLLLVRVLNHANREIYGVHVNRKTSIHRDHDVSRLYYSINKGCNVPNKNFLQKINDIL